MMERWKGKRGKNQIPGEDAPKQKEAQAGTVALQSSGKGTKGAFDGHEMPLKPDKGQLLEHKNDGQKKSKMRREAH